MKQTPVVRAAVLDEDGSVVASSVPDGTDWANAQQVHRIPLPNGGFLATMVEAPDASWSRFARAFVHETRSPLNALAIYLELVGTKHSAAFEGKPDPSLERILVKAQDQVRRVDELLRTFSDLWAPRGDTTNLAAIVRSAARFSEHEAIRRGFELKHQVCEQALVQTPPILTAAAVVSLMGGALQAPSESVITLKLELIRDNAEVCLTVSVQTPPGQEKDFFRWGEDAFRGVGAACVREGNTFSVTLATCAPEEAAA